MRAAHVSLLAWPARRWWVAAVAAAGFAVATGAPTDVVPNPLFDRVVAVTWWSYPTLAVTAVLGGLVMASYVRSPAQPVATGKTTGGGRYPRWRSAARSATSSSYLPWARPAP